MPTVKLPLIFCIIPFSLGRIITNKQKGGKNMTLKNYPCTAIGIAAGIAVIVGGIAADMLTGSKPCDCGIRHKAGKAMHTLGTCLDRAADSLQNQ